MIIIDPFLFCLSVVRSLKKFYSLQYKNFFSVNISQVSDLKILVNISYFQLYMTSFNSSPPLDVKGIFLNICKAFDRVHVPHDGLIYKVKCIGINGMFLKLIASVLEGRFERVVLKVKHPHGSQC